MSDSTPPRLSPKVQSLTPSSTFFAFSSEPVSNDTIPPNPDFDKGKDKLTFTKQTGKMIINEPVEDEKEEPQLAKTDAVGLPLPTASAAPQMSKSKGEQTDV
jgi:hypothetical protein